MTATAVLVHTPVDDPGRATASVQFEFVAPLGSIEAHGVLAELTWYLEEFHRWPTGVFQQRADRITALLPTWSSVRRRTSERPGPMPPRAALRD